MCFSLKATLVLLYYAYGLRFKLTLLKVQMQTISRNLHLWNIISLEFGFGGISVKLILRKVL